MASVFITSIMIQAVFKVAMCTITTRSQLRITLTYLQSLLIYSDLNHVINLFVRVDITLLLKKIEFRKSPTDYLSSSIFLTHFYFYAVSHLIRVHTFNFNNCVCVCLTFIDQAKSKCTCTSLNTVVQTDNIQL